MSIRKFGGRAALMNSSSLTAVAKIIEMSNLNNVA